MSCKIGRDLLVACMVTKDVENVRYRQICAFIIRDSWAFGHNNIVKLFDSYEEFSQPFICFIYSVVLCFERLCSVPITSISCKIKDSRLLEMRKMYIVVKILVGIMVIYLKIRFV